MRKLLMLSLCVLLAGCPSISPEYERAMDVVNQKTPPDVNEFASALSDLNEAMANAKGQLSETDIEDHDQVAYIIPLAGLAKARLYARVGQVVNQEKACWQAIRDAGEYLGQHIRGAGSTRAMFSGYAVFFRREKIRRHAFTILEETYRRVGEKDLESLMQMQIGFSDGYLRSKFAHKEEEYIRQAENASWVKKYNSGEEDVIHIFTVFLLALGRAAESASIQVEINDLEAQLQNTYDPYQRAQIQQRIANLQARDQASEEEYQRDIAEEEQRHEYAMQAIDESFRYTFANALQRNFDLLSLSPQIKMLPAYDRLQRQVNELDDYVKRAGYDERAVNALSDIRNSLDDLTRQAQAQARKGGRA